MIDITCKYEFSSKENSRSEEHGRRLIRWQISDVCSRPQKENSIQSGWETQVTVSFLPTTVTVEMKYGIFPDSFQTWAPRAGCQGGTGRQPPLRTSPLPFLYQSQILFTCKAHGKANLFSQAFASGMWGKVYFINCVCMRVRIYVCRSRKLGNDQHVLQFWFIICNCSWHMSDEYI